MPEDKIQTLHPAGKEGVNISRSKYDLVRGSILKMLEHEEEVQWKELAARVEMDIKDRLDGSPGWYFTTVKLDLEARKEIMVRRTKDGQMVSIT